jgi:hypothetical protein
MKKPSGPYADKLWREALRRAVLKRVEKQQRLDRIAEQVVAKAEMGDLLCAKEIGDRLDGRPAQAVEHTGEQGGPVKFILEWGRE